MKNTTLSLKSIHSINLVVLAFSYDKKNKQASRYEYEIR